MDGGQGPEQFDLDVGAACALRERDGIGRESLCVVELACLDENDQPNKALIGRICADQVVPYPPGIPVLVPGQRITDNIVEYLIRYLRVQNKVELHGVVYQGYFPSVRVLSAAEEMKIARLREATPARRAA